MSALYIIGLGLGLKGISVEGLEAVRKCENVFAEFYTSSVDYTPEELGKALGVKVKALERKQVEEEDIILKAARKEPTAFLVPGDPLTATTHTDLVMRAREKGIDVRIVHSASVISAVAETGLHLYKFGKTVSIPRPAEGYKPTSFYKTIVENVRDCHAHTLILLDIGMEVKEAIEILQEADKTGFFKGFKFVAASRLGSEDSRIMHGRLDWLKKQDLGKPPHVLVLPSSLHFQEKEFLEQFEVRTWQ